MKISLAAGQGLTFNDHKLTVDIKQDEQNIEKKIDGLYVNSLNGHEGGIGGTVSDGVSIIEVGEKPQVNVDYIQMIYSIGYRVVNDRSTPVLSYSDNVKTISDIMTEMNYYSSMDYTAYFLRTGDLLQLVTFSHGARPYKSTGQYMEESNRYIATGTTNNETKAMFVVNSATYNGKRCTVLSLTCIYVKTGGDEGLTFTVGTTYQNP